AAPADVSAEALPVAPEHVELSAWDEAPSLAPADITPAVNTLPPGSVADAPLPDFTFEPLPEAVPPAPAEPVAKAMPTLVFEASTAPVAPDAPQWTLSAEAARDDAAPTFASFDPVLAGSASQWDTAEHVEIAPVHLDGFDTGTSAADSVEAYEAPTITSGSAFDPVAAESDALELSDEPIEFTFDDALHNAGDVLSLAIDDAPDASVTVAADSIDLDAPSGTGLDVESLPTFLQAHVEPAAVEPTFDSAEPIETVVAEAAADDTVSAEEAITLADAAPVTTPAAGGVHEAVISKIELDDESTRFLAELDAAAAQFSTAPVADVPAAATGEDDAVAPAAAEPDSIAAGFEDDGENIDQDIREVFIEEFDEELVNLGNLLPVWRMAPDNMDRLRPIRRVFHTLKGSGRLVGARTLGEFSWKIEGMLNRVLDGSRPASPAVVAMVTQAYEVLPQLNAALRDGGRVSADLQAMQAIADRVAAGEETFHVPLQRAVPVATVTEAVVVADTDEAAIGTPANIDDVLREILEAEVEAHQATLQAWLQEANVAPQPVTDSLLRAVHTMNGAFAMTDVPEITAVTGGAESYIKRSLAADATPDAEGVEALSATAAAIRATMTALQAEAPRIPAQAALAARLQALADTLPEARWPALVSDDALELDEAEEDAGEDALDLDALAVQDAQDVSAQELAALSAQFDARDGFAVADDSTDAELQQAIIEADGLSVVEAEAEAAAPEELTSSDDLSAYYDADLPTGFDAPAAVSPVEDTDAAEAPAASGLEAVELTGADDLSRFYEHTLPTFGTPDVAATDEQAIELQAIELQVAESDALQEHVDATGEEVAIEEITAEEVTAEEVTAEEVTAEEVTAEEITIEEVTVEEVTLEA
ncbi:MAG: Hpt domain-containing protein, partial [Stenotrophomonas sp.]